VIKVYESTAGVRPGADSNCTTARVTGGKIISSDVNGNDIDVKDLNANEITDPNLIQTLENNKIHHIKKDLDNGKEIDKVIYKTD